METDTHIRFTQRDAPWEAGEVAHVTPAQADKLVRYGVAERVSWDEKDGWTAETKKRKKGANAG